jgi:long-chain acyl-CoA synthetase
VKTYISEPGDLPEGTLVDLFFESTTQFGKAPAQMSDAGGGAWHTLDHDEVYARVRTITAALRKAGVARGDNVGLLSENRPEWAHTDYAVLCAGARTVPLYPTLPANQIGFIIRHAGTKIVFVSTAAQLAKMQEAREECPELETIVVFDETAANATAGVITLRAFVDNARDAAIDDAAFRAEAERALPDDVATIIYTSGTTGEPKGVMLTHYNLFSNVNAALASAVAVGPEDIALSFLPLSHVFQRMVDYAMFRAGTPLAYVSSIDNVVAAMGAVHPTIAVAVPRVYEKIYTAFLSAKGLKHRLVLWARRVSIAWADATLAGRTPATSLRAQHTLLDKLVYSKLRAKIGGRMRCFISGGAPLAPEIARFFFGAGIIILEGYGLTETSPVTNANTLTNFRIGTVGRPIPGTELKIADDGEILVRGPQVMHGYYKNEQGTREVIDADGWFHTGDIGTIDDEGFLRITDRKKDLLVTAGGKNIAPQPIQNAAKASRFISETLLVGDRKPYAILLVVPNFQTLHKWAAEHGIDTADPEKLVSDPKVRAKYEQEVAARTASFARYEQPKKVLVLAHEFTLERGEITPKLSIRRRVVEEHNAAQIAALYAEPSPEHDPAGHGA